MPPRGRPRGSKPVVIPDSQWTQVEKLVQKKLAQLKREELALNAWCTNSRSSSVDASSSKVIKDLSSKVNATKASIRRILQEFSEGVNNTHVSYPSCGNDLEVLCSLCNKDDLESNDIFICDGEGCGRAYHQLCLEPPVLSTPSEEESWYCHKCHTLRACLKHVADAVDDGQPLLSWEDAFRPPLPQDDDDDEEEDEEEDYVEEENDDEDEDDDGDVGLDENNDDEEEDDDVGSELSDEIIVARTRSGGRAKGGAEGINSNSAEGISSKRRRQNHDYFLLGQQMEQLEGDDDSDDESYHPPPNREKKRKKAMLPEAPLLSEAPLLQEEPLDPVPVQQVPVQQVQQVPVQQVQQVPEEPVLRRFSVSFPQGKKGFSFTNGSPMAVVSKVLTSTELLQGDEVIAIDGKPVSTFEECMRTIGDTNRAFDVTFLRGVVRNTRTRTSEPQLQQHLSHKPPPQRQPQQPQPQQQHHEHQKPFTVRFPQGKKGFSLTSGSPMAVVSKVFTSTELLQGDEVIAIDGKPVSTFEKCMRTIGDTNRAFDVTFLRPTKKRQRDRR